MLNMSWGAGSFAGSLEATTGRSGPMISILVRTTKPIAVDLYRGHTPAGVNVLGEVRVPLPTRAGERSVKWKTGVTAEMLWCDEPVFADDFSTMPDHEVPTQTPYYIARIPQSGLFAFGKTRWGATLNLARLLRDVIVWMHTRKHRTEGAVFALRGAENFIGVVAAQHSTIAPLHLRDGYHQSAAWLKAVTTIRYDLLDHLKFQAVEHQNYDLAKEIREDMIKLKAMQKGLIPYEHWA